MVSLVRGGASARSVAQRFGVSLSHLQHWILRAGSLRLDRVVWTDRQRVSSAPANRTPDSVETRILQARGSLRSSPLGDCGAQAIRDELLKAAPDVSVPCVRTIGRILKRAGVLDGRIRTRRPPPPPGWYLPALMRREAELDSFDTVEGLVLAGGTQVEVLNAMSLHGHLPGSWPEGPFTTDSVLAALLAHWCQHGRPTFAQFDNALIFQGPHQYADTLGRVVRLCLQLDIIPVFAPPRETGFQAAIESYNARWQSRVWQRFTHTDLTALQHRSASYVDASRTKHALRIGAAAPLRRPLPKPFMFDPKAPLAGTVIFLRRTDGEGTLTVLGRPYPAGQHWQHRLVRAELNFSLGILELYALRRAASSHQPSLGRLIYQPLPMKPGRPQALPDLATRGHRLGAKATHRKLPT
jgi:hypothetical protein